MQRIFEGRPQSLTPSIGLKAAVGVDMAATDIIDRDIPPENNEGYIMLSHQYEEKIIEKLRALPPGRLAEVEDLWISCIAETTHAP